MKPAKITLYRTDGDTDALVVALAKRTETGVTYVAAAATATLTLEGGDTVAGVAGADGTGLFGFSPALVPAGAGDTAFDIAVTESGTTATYATGIIRTLAQVA